MFRPFTAIFVSASFATFFAQAENLGLTRADQSELSAPVTSIDSLPTRPWPQTEMERRADSLTKAPPRPSEEEGQSKGLVSVQEMRNPISPEKAKALNEANEQLATGKAEAGLKRLKLALEDPACSGYANAMIGTEYLKRHDYRAAVQYLSEAARLLPGLAATHSNLGYALGATGDWDNAEKELRKAIALEPSNPYPNFVLGVMLLNHPELYSEAKQRLLVAEHKLDRASLALAVLFTRERDVAAAEQAVVRIPESRIQPMRTYDWVLAAASLQNPAEAFGLFRTSPGEE